MRIRDQSIREVVNLIMGVRKMRNYVMRLCAFILRPWIRHCSEVVDSLSFAVENNIRQIASKFQRQIRDLR